MGEPWVRPCPSSLARKEIALPRDHLRLDRQLAAREPKRLLRQPLVDARELEHHPAGLDHGHPVLGCALAGAHPRLGRLLSHRLVREDVDPDLPATADLASHRDSGRLDLAVGDPSGLHRLEPEVARLHGRLALRHAPAPASLVLAELRLLRKQHQRSPPQQIVLSDGEKQASQGRTRIRVLGPHEATGATDVTRADAIGVRFAAAPRVRDVRMGAVINYRSSPPTRRPTARAWSDPRAGSSAWSCRARPGRPQAWSAPRAPPEAVRGLRPRWPARRCAGVQRCPAERRLDRGLAGLAAGPRPRPPSREAPSPSEVPPRLRA